VRLQSTVDLPQASWLPKLYITLNSKINERSYFDSDVVSRPLRTALIGLFRLRAISGSIIALLAKQNYDGFSFEILRENVLLRTNKIIRVLFFGN